MTAFRASVAFESAGQAPGPVRANVRARNGAIAASRGIREARRTLPRSRARNRPTKRLTNFGW
jgi:hypothetical protein